MENGKIRQHVDFSLSFSVVICSLYPFLFLIALCYTQEWKNKTLAGSKGIQDEIWDCYTFLFLFSFTSSCLSFFPSLNSTNGAEVDAPEATRKEDIIKEVKLTPPQNENCDPYSINRTHWIHRDISPVTKAVFGLNAAAVPESVKKLITLHLSKHERRTVRPKLVCSLQRGHTKPMSVPGILSGGCVLQSWQSHLYFLL